MRAPAVWCAAAIAIFWATSCGRSGGDAGDRGAAGESSAAEAPAGAAPGRAAVESDTAGGAPAPAGAERWAEWTATPAGVGPLRAGMSVAEAQAALGGRLEVPPRPDPECSYAVLRGAGDALALMVRQGRIARVEVRGRLVRTEQGAGVGDLEARVRALYAGRVQVLPHKYTDGHYLVVVPAAPGDSMLRLIFETQGDTVTTFRVGRRPEVEWVEGCS